MSRHRATLVLLEWLSVVLALFACAASAHADYLLGSGDRIRVSVDEWPAVSGDFTVRADGTVKLPVIGLVRASGLSAESLASSLSARMAERTTTSEPLNVQVEVTRHRPFFIIGDVQKPGEYEYQPSLTVLKAVGKASGFYRPESSRFLRPERDTIAARGNLQALEQKAARLHARLARLQAQLDNSEGLNIPDSLRGKMNDPVFRRVVDQERSLLIADRAALEQKIKALAGAKAISEREVASLTSQIESETRQLEYVKKELVKMRSLEERGLTISPRMLDLERLSAQITGARQSLETQILRARQDIHSAEQKIMEVRNAEAVLLKKDIEKTTDDLNETIALAKTQTELLAEAEFSTNIIALAKEESAIEYRFAIVRETDGGQPSEFLADESTEVAAGDVIKVERLTAAPRLAEPTALTR
jgi:protein involved in polysaccharide export with SLBB domain